MNLKELRERRIYAPVLCVAEGENGQGQDLLARFAADAKWSGRNASREQLRYMARYANELQYNIVRALEALNFQSSEVRWGDYILAWDYWHRTALFAVLRLGYEKIDVVLDREGLVYAVTEIGKAAESVQLHTGPNYGWPYACTADIPLLAGFRLEPDFLHWQRRAIENIWNSPRRHCHRCGSPVTYMTCDHRKGVLDAITGRNNYEYRSESP